MLKGMRFTHKIDNVIYTCALCGKTLASYNALGKHLTKYHNEITMKTYFDTYIEPFEHKCPFCENERHFEHGKYKNTCQSVECIKKGRAKTNLEKYGSVSSLHGTNEAKVKESIKEKYGVDNVFKLDSVQKKAKDTMMSKYGVEYSSQNPDSVKKRESTCLSKFGETTNLKNKDQQERIKETCREKYGSEYVCVSEYARAKTIAHNMEKYGVPEFMKTDEFRRKSAETMLLKYGERTPSRVKCIQAKVAATNIEKYGVKTPLLLDTVKQKAMDAVREKYGVDYMLQNDAAWYHVTHRGFDGVFHSSVEKKFAEMCKNRCIPYEYNVFINGKHWDFAIYNNQQKLSCIVEIDGEWCHSIISDSDGKRIDEEMDSERFKLIPDGVKFICTDSKNIQKAIELVCESIDMPYREWIDSIVNSLPSDFPYPEFTERRLHSDYDRLVKDVMNKRSKQAMSTVQYFHKSIYSARVGNNVSPVEAWNNKDMLRRCVENRFIYSSSLSSHSIASGFNVCKIAPKVSVFSPGLAKYLINEYLHDFDTIFDPFSGFSGRMLGAASLGKMYIGQDSNKVTVMESNEIIKFHNLKNVSVTVADSTVTTGSYDALFTCSPYGLKETWGNPILDKTCDEWIDVCLQNYTCKRYLFVVNTTTKYADKIVAELKHHSHFGDSYEYVVMI